MPAPEVGREGTIPSTFARMVLQKKTTRASAEPKEKSRPRCSYILPSLTPGESQQGRARPHCGTRDAPAGFGYRVAQRQWEQSPTRLRPGQHLTTAGRELSRDLSTSGELQSKERSFLLSHSSSRTHSIKVAFSILSLAVKLHKQFILKLDARGKVT